MIAPEAATSPAEREDAADRTTIPQSTETRLEAFYAAFAALSPEERKTAVKWIAEKNHARHWHNES